MQICLKRRPAPWPTWRRSLCLDLPLWVPSCQTVATLLHCGTSPWALWISQKTGSWQKDRETDRCYTYQLQNGMKCRNTIAVGKSLHKQIIRTLFCSSYWLKVTQMLSGDVSADYLQQNSRSTSLLERWFSEGGYAYPWGYLKALQGVRDFQKYIFTK